MKETEGGILVPDDAVPVPLAHVTKAYKHASKISVALLMALFVPGKKVRMRCVAGFAPDAQLDALHKLEGTKDTVVVSWSTDIPEWRDFKKQDDKGGHQDDILISFAKD